MKYLIIFGTFAFSTLVFSQTSRKVEETVQFSNSEFYKKHFEIKDMAQSNDKVALINSINFSELEYLRKEVEDVEYYIASLDITVILYSLNKSRILVDEFLINKIK